MPSSYYCTLGDCLNQLDQKYHIQISKHYTQHHSVIIQHCFEDDWDSLNNPNYQYPDNSLFICLSQQYNPLPKALKQKPKIIFRDPKYHPIKLDKNKNLDLKTHPTIIIDIPNLARFISFIAGCIYQHPSQKMTVIGITGTNGKTSTSHFLAQGLSLKYPNKICIIGTCGNGIWPNLNSSNYTTPTPVLLQKALYTAQKNGAEYAILEVSSHGLDQFRVNDIAFDMAIFTHLTQDHLDYHHNMENYYQAKKKLFLFKSLKHIFIHTANHYGQRLFKELKTNKSLSKNIAIYTLDSENTADFVYKKYSPLLNGSEFKFLNNQNQYKTIAPLYGQFQGENILSAMAVLKILNYSSQSIQYFLDHIQPIKGRMELVNINPLIIIDFAHTPDALYQSLKTLKDLIKSRNINNKLTVLFGCGGDRDKSKRPQMAKIAEKLADKIIITQDNSRSENIENIFNDIKTGFSEKKLKSNLNLGLNLIQFIPNRTQAIEWACKHLSSDDILLIAGKGHEIYNIELNPKTNKLEKTLCDEREIIKAFYLLSS